MGEANDTVQILIVPGTEPLVRFHPSVFVRLNIRPGSPYTCQWGSKVVSVLTVPDGGVAHDSALLTKVVANQLSIPDCDLQLRARVHEANLQIGPLIGILSTPVWRPKQRALLQTKHLLVLEKLLQAADQAGAVGYLFRIDDVDFGRLTTPGFFLVGGQWRRQVVALPDVVFDQVLSRRREQSKHYAQRREQLSMLYGRRIFNDGFFNKWEVHDWLRQDARLRRHIPETVRYTRASLAEAFLQRHTTTFFKPVHGSLGLGIVRVARQPDGTFHYDVKRAKQPLLHGTAANAQELIRVFRARLAARPYLLQEGLALQTYQDRPFDIRILLQRDGHGEWRRTKMFARVAKAGEFTSNISSGGEGVPVHKVLSEVYGKPGLARARQRAVLRVARLVTEGMERASGKLFGEMGLDIGVDMKGHVWVIEVNSKPWKAPTTEKGRQDLVDLSFRRPIEYAVWLTQQR